MPSGGKRKGAGRKPTGNAIKTSSWRIPPDVLAELRALAAQTETTAAAHLLAALREYLARHRDA